MKIIYEVRHRPLLKRLKRKEKKRNAKPKPTYARSKHIISSSCIRSGNGLGDLGDLHASADDTLT
jgi:hypothetical protein